MDRASSFWNSIANIYARQPIADEDAYQTKLKVTRNYFRPDMEVLEFGCGTGSTAIVHAPFVRHIDAFDYSAKMIEIAHAKAQAEGVDNVKFSQADILSLNVPDNRYDAVLGLNILHLLDERDAVIAKVFDMLKPGGIFVTSTICLGDMKKTLNLIMAAVIKALWFLPRLNVMTTNELVNVLTAIGFEVVHNWQPGKGKAVFIVARKKAVAGRS